MELEIEVCYSSKIIVPLRQKSVSMRQNWLLMDEICQKVVEKWLKIIPK
jgi:hypothetical protein